MQHLRHLNLDSRYTGLGLADGMLLALGLGAQDLLSQGTGQRLGTVALNAGVFAALTNFISSLLLEQYELRKGLLATERQLVITQRGQLLKSQLFRSGRRRAIVSSLVYAAAGFLGASLPLLPVLVAGGGSWAAVAVPLAALACLGYVAGHRGAGNAMLWALGMLAAGFVVTIVGVVFPV